MPTIAMEAKELILRNSAPFIEDLEGQTVDKFFEILDQKSMKPKIC